MYVCIYVKKKDKRSTTRSVLIETHKYYTALLWMLNGTDFKKLKI